MTVVPAKFQPPLPVERVIRNESAGPEAVEMDVVFVGGGPAGFAGAIELARLARHDGGALGDLRIAVLENSKTSASMFCPAPSSTLERSTSCSWTERSTSFRFATRSKPSACTS